MLRVPLCTWARSFWESRSTRNQECGWGNKSGWFLALNTAPSKMMWNQEAGQMRVMSPGAGMHQCQVCCDKFQMRKTNQNVIKTSFWSTTVALQCMAVVFGIKVLQCPCTGCKWATALFSLKHGDEWTTGKVMCVIIFSRVVPCHGRVWYISEQIAASRFAFLSVHHQAKGLIPGHTSLWATV